MAISKAQQKSVNKFVKNHYDRINVTFPKGKKDELKQIADNMNLSVNSLITKSVDYVIDNSIDINSK